MHDLAGDLRYACRQLLHTPVFTLVAVLTLALGIGASTAFFGIVNSMALKPIPGVRLDGVFAVGDLPLASVRAIEDATPAPIVAVAGRYPWFSTIHIPGKAERIAAEIVTGGYARVFDLHASVGRWFTVEDDRGGARVVVVSDRLWREWFNSDEVVVGRTTIRLENTPFTIIGVAPLGFRGPYPGFAARTDVWLPVGAWPAAVATFQAAREVTGRPVNWLDRFGMSTVVRTRNDARPVAIAGALAPFARPTETGQPRRPSTPMRVTAVNDALLPTSVSRYAMTIMALASLTLIAAGANLANMLYARATTRTGEVAVRFSLGASRSRVMRLFLTETIVVSAAAAIAGFGIAVGGLELFGRTIGSLRLTEIRWDAMSIDPSPDYRVFLFAVAGAVASALAVGLLTAWHASRVPPLHALASGSQASVGGRGGWLRTTLVSIQITAAVLLVMSAGSAYESTIPQLSRRLHYDSAHVLGAQIDLSLHEYNETRSRLFVDRALAATRALPGIDGAAISDSVPGGVGGMGSSLSPLVAEPPPEGLAGVERRVYSEYSRVSPGFLDLIDLPLLEGRDFVDQDTVGAPLVGLISRSAAASLWPGQSAIGKRFQLGVGEYITVVGVTADPLTSGERVLGATRPGARAGESYNPAPFAFVPWRQWYKPGRLLVMVRAGDPASRVEPLRAALRSVEPEIAIFETNTIDEAFLAWAAPRRAAGILLTTLGLVSLGIATLGVYGVIAYFVSRRVREFGLRLALGATPRSLIKLVVDHAIHIVLVGLLPGVLLAALGQQLLAMQIASFFPNEIRTWVVVPVLILAAGLIASLLPARRAARVDPNVALREL
jgi:predicted permease